MKEKSVRLLIIISAQIFFLFFPYAIFGQERTDSSIATVLDNYLTSANQISKFNGTALIAQNGTILLKKGYGFKNTSTHSLNDTNTIFQIGSLTKSFTSIVILKLQEEGKLSVNDKLSKLLPDYPNGDKITIENLLTHTSGIHNYTEDISEQDTNIICYPVTRQRVLDVFENRKLEFKPGTKFAYNNSAFFLLGMIIEKVTGLQYESVVRKLIFEPLGMSHSGFDYKNLADTNKAQGYVIFARDTSREARVADSTVYFSAGAIYSTAGDLYKWATAISNHQLLNDSSWRQAFANYHNNNYGYGFFVDSVHHKSYIRHSGGGLGLMSDYVYFPKENLIIILLNNFGNYGQSLFPLAVGISSIVFHLPYAKWTSDPAAVKLDESQLRKYVGTYEYNADHRLIVTFKNGNLFIEATNPKDHLPRLKLYALNETNFYIKEAQLKFGFVNDATNAPVKLMTYVVEEEKEDWKKIK